MPFYFNLPTTSHLSLQDHVSSDSHPSLPTSASTNRGVLKSALKKHKRLPIASQASHLPVIFTAVSNYIPHLLAIDAGLSGHSVADEEVLVDLESEVEVQWRANLSTRIGGGDGLRTKVRSMEYELLFTLLVLGEARYLAARTAIHTLYDATTPTTKQRTAAIQTAMQHYLEAQSVWAYASSRAQQLAKEPPVPDIASATLSALASLALAEATLIAVLKDDPYPATVVQGRNEADKDWMFKSPEIPKVRAHLFARLCIAAADHAAKGLSMLGGSSKVTDKVRGYFEDLRRCARGKACRFLAIDAELSGKTGDGVAWLRGARRELGFSTVGQEEKANGRGFSKLKKAIEERREDRKVDKGAEWGTDAGRFEEGRVVDMLMVKWEKLNNTVNFDIIPPSDQLIAAMPSGREYYNPKPWIPPMLDPQTLASMRAPPDPEAEAYRPDGDDSDDEDDENTSGPSKQGQPVGAFPGTTPAYY